MTAFIYSVPEDRELKSSVFLFFFLQLLMTYLVL